MIATITPKVKIKRGMKRRSNKRKKHAKQLAQTK